MAARNSRSEKSSSRGSEERRAWACACSHCVHAPGGAAGDAGRRSECAAPQADSAHASSQAPATRCGMRMKDRPPSWRKARAGVQRPGPGLTPSDAGW